jgi:hypothetical protein
MAPGTSPSIVGWFGGLVAGRSAWNFWICRETRRRAYSGTLSKE